MRGTVVLCSTERDTSVARKQNFDAVWKARVITVNLSSPERWTEAKQQSAEQGEPPV